ncbi:hypothetical protein FQN53_005075 [Emmonsiellopsis sp. PD_33]|nr:hypothetical protein FQN53_005075 [Emmonsiellopsis sp. PD_33]
MDSDGPPTHLNYNVFFGSPDESIAPGIPPNPRMARCVESLIIRWIMKVCRCLQYPSISRKTVEDQTTTIARSIWSSIDPYHRTGYTAEGPYGHHAFIYDLTSFTSSLHEQRHFVDRLAEYCHGNVVKVVDAWSGVIDNDLRDLI